MSFIIRFSYGEITFQGIVNLKNVPGNWNQNWKVVWYARDQKKETQRKGKKVLLEGKLVRNIRFCATFCTSYPKKCTCFPIGNVRDRRRERYNWVYVLSRVRANRVSLYFSFWRTATVSLELNICSFLLDFSLCLEELPSLVPDRHVFSEEPSRCSDHGRNPSECSKALFSFMREIASLVSLNTERTVGSWSLV